MYGGLRGSRDRSTLGSRAERGAVGRTERSIDDLYDSSSVCHEVETGKIEFQTQTSVTHGITSNYFHYQLIF